MPTIIHSVVQSSQSLWSPRKRRLRLKVVYIKWSCILFKVLVTLLYRTFNMLCFSTIFTDYHRNERNKWVYWLIFNCFNIHRNKVDRYSSTSILRHLLCGRGNSSCNFLQFSEGGIKHVRLIVL